MKRLLFAVICAVLAGLPVVTCAQNVPVRGTITAIDGSVLAVKTREGRDMKVELAKDATILNMRSIKLADIKPGTPLGTTAVEGPDGKLVAREVHLFEPERGVPNPGHRPMAEPRTTMTNATVSTTAQVTNGRELTLTYEGGSKQVLVPENTPIVMPVPGARSDLVVWAAVSTTASMDNDGKLFANRVQVTRP